MGKDAQSPALNDSLRGMVGQCPVAISGRFTTWDWERRPLTMSGGSPWGMGEAVHSLFLGYDQVGWGRMPSGRLWAIHQVG